jgi:diguanylate cyclase
LLAIAATVFYDRSKQDMASGRNMMPVTHEPWLVALSLVVAIQGAYVGLSLAMQVRGALGARRRWLLAGAALSLGVATWSMHFVGMLAARLPFPVDYLVFPTLLSFLICVLVVGGAVFAVSAGALTMTRLAAAAVFMGLGIASMHYIGMAALHASAHMTHDARLVAVSIAVAIVASGLALRLATGTGRVPLFLSAAALGFAIAGMHYTAMWAVSVFPHHGASLSAPALSVDLLAIVVAVVAFVVSGLFLLILVPERADDQRAEPGSPEAGAANRIGSSAPFVVGQADGAPAIDGLGSADEEPAEPEGHEPARHLPIEHDGVRRALPIESVVAVHANAHYTYVFDGTTKFFCPLAIGDVESRLDPARFARVHRSHIINVEHIVRLKRATDSGLIELNCRDPYTVPVSRSRLPWVKSHLLGQKAPAAV